MIMIPDIDNSGDVNASGDVHMLKMPDIDDSGDVTLG